MMSESSTYMFHSLSTSTSFKEAIKEFVAIEIQARTDEMRALLRENSVPRALIAEGHISMLEELQALLVKYASQYRPRS